jgi:uncharacterized repeat protein (TIGR04076 family)
MAPDFHRVGKRKMSSYKVQGKIIEIRGSGTCSYGHQVGETFAFGEMGSAICQWAQNSIFPFYTVLKFGGKFPWQRDPDRLQVACPDPDNVVVFELWRERES